MRKTYNNIIHTGFYCKSETIPDSDLVQLTLQMSSVFLIEANDNRSIEEGWMAGDIETEIIGNYPGMLKTDGFIFRKLFAALFKSIFLCNSLKAAANSSCTISCAKFGNIKYNI